MVPRGRLLDPLIRDARVEDGLYAVGDQPRHVAVRDLRRIAFRFAGDRLDAQFVDAAGGLGRQHDPEAKFPKERGPERIVFIKVQHPRDADGPARRLFRGQGFIIKDPAVFVIEQVRDLPLYLLLAQPALAAVAADELPAALEAVHGQHAVVGAALAAGHGGLVFQVDHLVEGHHRGRLSLVPFPGDQRRAESAHDAGDVRADRLAAGDLLEAAQHGVIVEGAALDDDIGA